MYIDREIAELLAEIKYDGAYDKTFINDSLVNYTRLKEGA